MATPRVPNERSRRTDAGRATPRRRRAVTVAARPSSAGACDLPASALPRPHPRSRRTGPCGEGRVGSSDRRARAGSAVSLENEKTFCLVRYASPRRRRRLHLVNLPPGVSDEAAMERQCWAGLATRGERCLRPLQSPVQWTTFVTRERAHLEQLDGRAGRQATAPTRAARPVYRQRVGPGNRRRGRVVHVRTRITPPAQWLAGTLSTRRPSRQQLGASTRTVGRLAFGIRRVWSSKAPCCRNSRIVP